MEMEKQAKSMKEIEDNLTDRLLMELAAQNLKSLNIEGVARVAVKDTYHVEIADINKLSLAMFKQMLTAVQNGRSISDALLLQQRVSKSQVEDMLTAAYPDGIPEGAYYDMGLLRVEDRTISITKN